MPDRGLRSTQRTLTGGMIAGVMRYLRELREGFRVLCSRDFWRLFRDYWSSEAISARMDEWTARLREQLGKDPDWDLERRRARRRVHRDDE